MAQRVISRNQDLFMDYNEINLIGNPVTVNGAVLDGKYPCNARWGFPLTNYNTTPAYQGVSLANPALVFENFTTRLPSEALNTIFDFTTSPGSLLFLKSGLYSIQWMITLGVNPGNSSFYYSDLTIQVPPQIVGTPVATQSNSKGGGGTPSFNIMQGHFIRYITAGSRIALTLASTENNNSINPTLNITKWTY